MYFYGCINHREHIQNMESIMSWRTSAGLELFAAGSLTGAIIFTFVFAPFHIAHPVSQSSDMTYSDFVSVMLTGITVLLAVVALAVGVLAYWGFAATKDLVQKATEKHVDELINGTTFDKKFNDLVEALVRKKIDSSEFNDYMTVALEKSILQNAETRAKAMSPNGNEEPFSG